MTNPDIGESGFEKSGSKVTRIKNEATSNNQEQDHIPQSSKSSSFGGGSEYFTKRNLIGGGGLTLIVALLIFGYQFSQTSSQKVETNPLVAKTEVQSPFGDSVAQKSVPINQEISGDLQRDKLATLLLENYPTKSEVESKLDQIRGADVSQEELDVFLLAVKNNSDSIKRLENVSPAAINRMNQALSDVKSTLAVMKKDVSELNESISEHGSKLDKLEKNSGWYHNRISSLEGNPVVSNKPDRSVKNESKPISSRRLEMTTESSWLVNGASANLAFISNIESGKKLRVTRGFDIPGCGQVTDIDPSNQKVTTTSCVIKN
ncbi:hypothetical protein [Teredinibacter purpureus]|uniref:hypothetical protein n=1 Tax=Teredinibacter purpureus TaxID=2731756 RepID=UPI0005F77275|nr:hypothetical protein [Teredinibacter purpureus]